MSPGVTQYREWCDDQIVEDSGHRYLVQYLDRHQRLRDRPAVFVERNGRWGLVWAVLPGKRADEILANITPRTGKPRPAFASAISDWLDQHARRSQA